MAGHEIRTSLRRGGDERGKLGGEEEDERAFKLNSGSWKLPGRESCGWVYREIANNLEALGLGIYIPANLPDLRPGTGVHRTGV